MGFNQLLFIMKKNLFFYTITGLFLVGCTSPKSQEAATVGILPVEFSASYQPHMFDKDNRMEKITQLLQGADSIFSRHAEEYHLPGVVYGVVVDDSLVFSGGLGTINLATKEPASTNSLFRIASMSKSFTAMAILRLRDEGLLSITDKAADYIPELSGLEYLTEDAPHITIRHLLTMTAGFPEDNPWGDRQLDVTDEVLVNFIKRDVAFSAVPSTQYEYSNLGFALLGNIITRVSGMPYQQYITENILEPLGMNNTTFEYADIPENKLAIGYRWEDNQWKDEPMLHDGAYGAMGGLITSINDFSKYVSFHLSAWPPRSGSDFGPVKRSSLREMHEMTQPRLASTAKDYQGNPCPLVVGYGYGLRITKYCDGKTEVAHGGALPGFGSTYLFYPDYGIGVMAFCNLTYTSALPTKIKDIILNETGIVPRKLPVSDILAKRKEQVYELITSWDTTLEQEVIAMNFYLDKSRESRKNEAEEKLKEIGTVVSITDITPQNQLRGTFDIQGKEKTLRVFFTLSPEVVPKVQRLNLWVVDTTG